MNMDASCPYPGGHDLAVLGAGSAGFAAAIAAADLGARVALIGHGTVGGTCVNIGCVPSKTMIRAAEAVHAARGAARFPGLAGTAQVTNWTALIGAKQALVDTLRAQKYADLLASYPGITSIAGRARLAAGGVAMDGRIIRAAKVVIATGARPAIPEIPGLAAVPFLDSTSALELQAPPRSLIVLGAGYVGCELAQMFARLGVAVTLVARRRVLPEAEPEIGAALAGYLEAEGVTVRTGLACRRAVPDGNGVALHIVVDGRVEMLRAERLLVATGRTPNTEDFDGDVALDRGGVKVDAWMRTSRAGAYAAGDVTGRDMFVYMAAHGGRIAALNALDGDSRRCDRSAIPWVVFTDPQLAGVGLTEAAARAAGHSVKVSVVPLESVPRALAARDTRGLIKLIADARTDRLLGAQILAPEGGDSIMTAAVALRAGMTAHALAETIFPYLTTVEGLKLAALGFETDLARLSCCAGGGRHGAGSKARP